MITHRKAREYYIAFTPLLCHYAARYTDMIRYTNAATDDDITILIYDADYYYLFTEDTRRCFRLFLLL